MADFNGQVADDNDDAGTLDGTWSLTNHWLSLGYDWSEPDKTGLRFQNVTIPNGATILTAKIELKAVNSDSSTTCSVKIYAEDVDDASAFSTEANFDGRDKTPVAGIAWTNIGAWTNGSWYDSPSIVSAIQNVVNRGGWASGQDMAILILDNSSDEGAARFARSYENETAGAAKLTITYSVGGKTFSKCFIAG